VLELVTRGIGKGERIDTPFDSILSSDEKNQYPGRGVSVPRDFCLPAPGTTPGVSNTKYERGGAIAVLGRPGDVRQGRVLGRCETPTTGIEPFGAVSSAK